VIIKQKRIRNLSAHLHGATESQSLVCAIPISEPDLQRLTQLGFTRDFADGETLVPAIIGPVSRFNADGRLIPDKSQPMETGFRTVEWSWPEMHGAEHVKVPSRFLDVPYRRYPRISIEPPSIELTLAQDASGRQILRAPAIAKTEPNSTQLLHTINLFLESFGRCELLGEELISAAQPPVHQLNWIILPPGPSPWPQSRDALASIVLRARPGCRPFVEHRSKVLKEYGPDLEALGSAGFGGYVVFGFSRLNLYVCESSQRGNATYIFGADWECFCRLPRPRF